MKKTNLAKMLFAGYWLFTFSVVECQSPLDLLNQHLGSNGHAEIEGHMCSVSSDQPSFLRNLLQANPFISTVAEIGFNAGHSSVVFLDAKSNIVTYSFDIMSHSYVKCGKAFIDQFFPNRHVLIEGDSTQSVPLFYLNNPSMKFDLIFIDGNHGYEFVLKDIQNMQKFAHKNTILILDDAFPGMEPDQACTTCEKMGLVKREEYHISGHIPTEWPRAWLICKYVLSN